MKVYIVLVVLLVLALGYWYLYKRQSPSYIQTQNSTDSVASTKVGGIVNVKIPALYPCMPYKMAKEPTYWTYPRKDYPIGK